MAIQYSGNAAIYSFTTPAGSSPAAAVATESFLLTNLVTAGWTNSIVFASDVLTFTLQPAANSTFTLDASPSNETYTFVSSSPTGNQILIDTTLANTLQNVLNALNSGPGSGTKYGSTLTPPPNMTASVTATTLKVTYKTGSTGSAGNGAPVSTSGTINATWASATLLGGYNFMLSTITPQGLQVGIQLSVQGGSFYNPGSSVLVIPCDRTQTRVASAAISGISASNSTLIKLIANKYQFVMFQPGSTASNVFMNGIGVGVPFITSQFQAPLIVSASNANPIVCNVPNHGFNNSDQVLVVGAIGNTAANGIFNITVIDANNFSLPVAGNGTYTANTAYVSDLTIGNTINEAIWSCGVFGGSPITFRNSGFHSEAGFLCVDSNIADGTGSSSADLQLIVNASEAISASSALQWYDNTYVIQEPFLAWGVTTSATGKIIGQMWDAVVVRFGLTLDQTASFDSPAHSWWTFGTGNNNSLMLATT